MNWDWSLDGWIVAAGVLCAIASSLLGSFLVLRKLSMLGDAVSHAVLPGLAAAFLITSSRSSLPMFLGAVIVGILTALFTEWIRGFGKVDEGASMGVVFTSLFALGLVMIVQAADHVDLDPGCVLYGSIETTYGDMWQIGGFEITRAVLTLAIVTVVNLLFVVVFFKELKISAFDPSLATTMGFSSSVMHYSLMVLVAVTAVASFESVGNVLVVAMFIVPPAAAYLLTNRLGVMIGLSTAIAATGAVLGHVGAITIPRWFGFSSTPTAPMMAVAVGALFLLAFLFSPLHGLIPKMFRRFALSQQILSDDVVAYLYRLGERDRGDSVEISELSSELITGRLPLRVVLSRLSRQGLIRRNESGIELTETGQRRGRKLVRSHRLWESYLVEQVDLDSSRIHDKAERWEHFTDRRLRDELESQTSGSHLDPHGTEIPPEGDPPRE